MELKSLISSLFLNAGKDLGFSPNQILHPVPLLLTVNNRAFPYSGCNIDDIEIMADY